MKDFSWFRFVAGAIFFKIQVKSSSHLLTFAWFIILSCVFGRGWVGRTGQ